MSMQSKGFKFWHLKGQCVGIEAVYVLVNITLPLYDDVFVHLVINKYLSKINIACLSKAIRL